jgi:hypothetical protein
MCAFCSFFIGGILADIFTPLSLLELAELLNLFPLSLLL